MNDDVVQLIVRHTVMYAASKNNILINLSLEEMHTFIGILLLSGYVPLPRRRMFWEQSNDCHNMLVLKSMRRNRFEEMFRYLHVFDNEIININDKISKVRPLLDKLNEFCYMLQSRKKSV